MTKSLLQKQWLTISSQKVFHGLDFNCSTAANMGEKKTQVKTYLLYSHRKYNFAEIKYQKLWLQGAQEFLTKQCQYIMYGHFKLILCLGFTLVLGIQLAPGY